METFTFSNTRYEYTVMVYQKEQWTNNCYGDCYTNTTYAELLYNGFIVARVFVVKHIKDQHDPVIGRTVAISRLFKKYSVPKQIRKKLWDMVGEKRTTQK